MRNTTKLKHILLKYTASFDMNDEGLFTLTINNKYKAEEFQQFEGKSYAIVLSKAYSYLLKNLKNEEKDLLQE